MLSHLATSAARSWTCSSCRRVCSCSTLPRFSRHLTSGPTPDDYPLPYQKFVVKRLQTVRNSLGITFRSTQGLRFSSSEEFEQWKDAISAADFEEALSRCGERLLSAPTWVLLYLFSCKVHAPSHAIAAVNVMLQHFPTADKVLQPALITLTVRFLARQRVEAPIPNLIKLFIILDLPEPATQFNLLLRSLSYFTPSPVPAKAITHLIDTMHGRQLKLHARTYRTLLSNSLVSLELAKKLQQSMRVEGVQPNRQHLEAYLRVFAHHGAVHASARYLNLIREDTQKTDDIVPYGVGLSSSGARAIKSDDSRSTRWNTEFMMSFKRHTGSAFQYLRDMVEDKDFQPTIIPRIARKERRISSGFRKDRPLVWKHRIHVTDWVTVLNVAARDPRVSSEQLLQLFENTRAAGKLPPTVAMFTVLMRGLSKKGDYETALSVWERCCMAHSRRRKMDTKALTVAMDVLVTNGHHLVAFDTLVESTGVLIDKKNKPPKRSSQSISQKQGRRALFSRRARVDPPLVNALMNAYQKNGRPDLVFKLWDVYHTLFGVYPNADTLTILLDAALSVAGWDRTFRGLLEKLGLHDFFGNASSHPPFIIRDKNRAQIVQHVQANIKRGTTFSSQDREKSEKKFVQVVQVHMRKTLWNGELAAHKAIRLFQEILIGNYPELKDITSPARAVWPDEAQSASPIRDALSSLGSRLRGKQASDDGEPLLVGPSLFPSSGTSPPPSSATSTPTSIPIASPHPQITPNSQTFASYIHLLGRTNRPSQIPLTLAWMRYLGIPPLKRSLAMAIALWSEASMRGPLIERYGARESEFDKLIGWLEGWLGKDGMPSEMAVSWAFRKLRSEREE